MWKAINCYLYNSVNCWWWWNFHDVADLQTPRRTRWRTPLIQKFIRMYNDKNSATIVGAAIYIAVKIKHTNFCIYGWTLPKISIIRKKASNKSCSELNFKQKSSRARMSIPIQYYILTISIFRAPLLHFRRR